MGDGKSRDTDLFCNCSLQGNYFEIFENDCLLVTCSEGTYFEPADGECYGKQRKIKLQISFIGL